MKHVYCFLTAVLLLSSCHSLLAQQDGKFHRRLEAGGIFSFKGCGLSLVAPMKGGGMGEIRLLADFEHVLINHEARPGTRIQLLRHFGLKEMDLGDDLAIQLTGGPGLTAGLVRDRGKDAGYLIALSVGGGADFLFKTVPVSVFVGLSADIGAHVIIRNQYDNTMTFYQNGWRRAWYPEVSVKYRF